MRFLLLFVSILALPTVAAMQDAPRAPDTALLQRFADASPGADRRQLFDEEPSLRIDEARSGIQTLASALAKQGRRADAVRLLEAALELADLANAPRSRASALINLGQVFGQAGDYARAAAYLDEGLSVAERAADEPLIAAAGNNLGNVYRRRGEYDKALDVYQRTLAANEAAGREGPAARTLNNLGMTRQEQGDFHSALEYYLRSLAIKERIGPPDDVITTLGNIGSLHALQGDNQQAIEFMERALVLAERLKNVRLVVNSTANIGRLLLASGRADEAEARLTRAAALADDLRFADLHGEALAGLGSVELARRRWPQATGYFVRAQQIFETIGDPVNLGRVLVLQARLEIARQRPEAAAGYADQARRTLAAAGTPPILIDVETTHGEAMTRLRRWDAAVASYERAIELTERSRALVAGDAEARLRFLESGSNPYFGLAHAHASAGRPAEALQAAERGRARTLLDMLAGGQAGIDELSPADRERQIELDTALNELHRRLAVRPAPAGAGAAEGAELGADLERLRRTRDEFYLGLDARHPRLRFARGVAPVLTVAEIAATLPARTALVEFIVVAREVWVAALVPRPGGEPRLVVKPAALPAPKVMALAAQFTRQVATRDLAFGANARALYAALLGPVDTELQSAGQLIVVPHAGLWEVPFQALLTPRGKYLIEERALAYAPSASALKQLNARRRPRAAQPRVVAFGDPRQAGSAAAALPNAAREVREVAAVYGASRSVVAVAGEATEARFRQLAPQADILHIATHGVIDDASPLFSYVMLAGRGGGAAAGDGRLEGRELLNMQLGAELVVLSACETARGRIAAGEGVVGLSWALFAAGASTAAVSLWPVDSASTTDLMAAFHRERHARTGPAPAPTAQALRAAQVRALGRPGSRHPFYWAGFVVIGVP